jgi:hypothetical protein
MKILTRKGIVEIASSYGKRLSWKVILLKTVCSLVSIVMKILNMTKDDY